MCSGYAFWAHCVSLHEASVRAQSCTGMIPARGCAVCDGHMWHTLLEGNHHTVQLSIECMLTRSSVPPRTVAG